MAEQKKMKLNYKLTFLIGFGFMASSIAWSVYNAYVPPILDEMLSASPTVAGIAEKLPWLATLFGGTDVVGAGVVGGLIGAIMVIDNVFGVIFQPLFGKISDRTHSRLGKRRPYLLFGIPAAALFFILIPRMPYIWTLMLCVICFNLIMSLWRSPVVALMPDLTPPSLRSEGNAVINLMGGLGTLLGMGSGMIVIAIMTLFMGSKPATDAERPYVFIFTAVVMLICLLVVMLTVKEPDSRLKNFLIIYIIAQKLIKPVSLQVIAFICFDIQIIQGSGCVITLYQSGSCAAIFHIGKQLSGVSGGCFLGKRCLSGNKQGLGIFIVSFINGITVPGGDPHYCTGEKD